MGNNTAGVQQERIDEALPRFVDSQPRRARALAIGPIQTWVQTHRNREAPTKTRGPSTDAVRVHSGRGVDSQALAGNRVMCAGRARMKWPLKYATMSIHFFARTRRRRAISPNRRTRRARSRGEKARRDVEIDARSMRTGTTSLILGRINGTCGTKIMTMTMTPRTTITTTITPSSRHDAHRDGAQAHL